jgi:hypothetical protein
MIILGQSCFKENQPLNKKTKMLLAIFVLSMFVITRGYSGLLISNLTKPQTLNKLDTIEDVLKSDSEIIFFLGTGTYNHFLLSTDPIDVQILEKYRNQKDIFIPKIGDFSQSVYNENTVMFGSRNAMEYSISARYTTLSGQSSVYLGKQHIQGSGEAFAIQKGSPLEDEMSKQ